MYDKADELIDWDAFAETQKLLGSGIVRILGYFGEDGMKSVAAIEEAMHLHDSAGLVMPAHTLKGVAYQFGAQRLGDLAEEIEVTARHYVEIHQDPSDLIKSAAALRPVFEKTMLVLEAEMSPLVERRPAAPKIQRLFGQPQYQ